MATAASWKICDCFGRYPCMDGICREKRWMDFVILCTWYKKCINHAILRPMMVDSLHYFSPICGPLLGLEPVPCHAAFVLLDCAFAVFLRVVALGEEHAVVSGCLFVFADTTWLDFGSCFTSGLEF